MTYPDDKGPGEPTGLFAISIIKAAHVTDNHGLVAILPHMNSVSRAGGPASTVTHKSEADCESTCWTNVK